MAAVQLGKSALVFQVASQNLPHLNKPLVDGNITTSPKCLKKIYKMTKMTNN